MIEKIGKSKRFKPKDKEYIFRLYSFDSPSDFSTDTILEGQSIVFISERYEEDGKHGHHIHYAASTNDLARLSSFCDWTALLEKDVNCLGVMLIENDMEETEVIKELQDDDHFSALGEIATVNSEELHFLQGNDDFFEKVTADDQCCQPYDI